MAPERLTSSRARATALAVAFSVVAGGAALVAIPQIATAVEEGAADGAITTESTSIPVSGSGFTAGNVVYAQVKLPDGTTNWSWNSTPFTAAEDGTVTGELTSAEGFAAGVYEITLFESDDVSQTFTVEVVEADDTTTPTLTGEPSETPGETEPEQTPDETTPEETDDAGAGADGDEADSGVEGDDAGDDDSGADDSSDAGVDGVAPPVENGDDEATGDDDEATVVEPRAWAEQERYSAQEASGSGITYHLEGFTPGVELELVLTLPSGEQAEFSSNEPIVPDADGTYVGTITYSGTWPAGDYSVTLRTADGATIPVDLTPPAETDPAAPGDDEGETGDEGVVGDPDDGTDGADGVDGTDDGADGTDEGTDGTGDETRTVDAALSAVQPAPVQEASFAFSVDGAQAGGGGSTGGSDASNDGGLASTGGDFAFGAAGLGLLVVGAGAIVLIGGRFLGRRRDA